MGHANLTNISTFFIKRLYAKGTLSIREAVLALQAKGEKLHASEGAYTDDFMLAHGLEEVIAFLLQPYSHTCKVKATPIIEPVELTPQQTKIYNDWIDPNGNQGNWDCGNDGMGGEYGVLDSIHWRFTKSWRKHIKDVPVLESVTN